MKIKPEADRYYCNEVHPALEAIFDKINVEQCDPWDRYAIALKMVRVTLVEMYNITCRIYPHYEKSISVGQFLKHVLTVMAEKDPKGYAQAERNAKLIEQLGRSR